MSSKYTILKYYKHSLMYVQDIIGDKVTNNEQLDKLGYTLFKTDYLGTFPSDHFPKYIRDGNVFILNTDSSRSANKHGHWIAFAKINKRLYYYDSFARPPSELTKLWKKKRMINANKSDRDQSYLSDSCGSRAIAFLMLAKRFGEKAINVV